MRLPLCMIFMILVSLENVKKWVLGGRTITSKTKINLVWNFFLHSDGLFGTTPFEKISNSVDFLPLRQTVHCPEKMRSKLWKPHIVRYACNKKFCFMWWWKMIKYNDKYWKMQVGLKYCIHGKPSIKKLARFSFYTTKYLSKQDVESNILRAWPTEIAWWIVSIFRSPKVSWGETIHKRVWS